MSNSGCDILKMLTIRPNRRLCVFSYPTGLLNSRIQRSIHICDTCTGLIAS